METKNQIQGVEPQMGSAIPFGEYEFMEPGIRGHEYSILAELLRDTQLELYFNLAYYQQILDLLMAGEVDEAKRLIDEIETQYEELYESDPSSRGRAVRYYYADIAGHLIYYVLDFIERRGKLPNYLNLLREIMRMRRWAINRLDFLHR